MKLMYIKLVKKTKIISIQSHKPKSFFASQFVYNKNNIVRRNYISNIFVPSIEYIPLSYTSTYL